MSENASVTLLSNDEDNKYKKQNDKIQPKKYAKAILPIAIQFSVTIFIIIVIKGMELTHKFIIIFSFPAFFAVMKTIPVILIVMFN